jgi:serine/threonine protein kinase
VHGDLKPGNVMIDAADGVKIMDFGLARRRLSSAENSESPSWDQETLRGLSGTPAYMSPEQSQGQPLTGASDVFSLGLILYEVVEGRQVISGSNIVEALRQIDEIDAELTAQQAPEPFRGVIEAALVRDPIRRTITMSEIAKRLSAHFAWR